MKKILIIILLILLLLLPELMTPDQVIISDKSFLTLPVKIPTVSTNIYDRLPNYKKLATKNKFTFDNNNFYNDRIGLIATNSKKIIDISSYQGNIKWDIVKKQIDGVIIRIGYGNKGLDSKLEQNIKEVKRLKIPYGIYLFSYAENKIEAIEESKFTKELINKYEMNPTLGIYYDIEEFYIKGEKVYINKDIYQHIIEAYISNLKEYNVSVYTNAKMYKYKFNEETKKYVTWIAQYNYYFKYEPNYKMWQYTDQGIIDGIKGNVDMNVMFG